LASLFPAWITPRSRHLRPSSPRPANPAIRTPQLPITPSSRRVVRSRSQKTGGKVHPGPLYPVLTCRIQMAPEPLSRRDDDDYNDRRKHHDYYYTSRDRDYQYRSRSRSRTRSRSPKDPSRSSFRRRRWSPRSSMDGRPSTVDNSHRPRYDATSSRERDGYRERGYREHTPVSRNVGRRSIKRISLDTPSLHARILHRMHPTKHPGRSGESQHRRCKGHRSPMPVMRRVRRESSR
jgi:hypothetical protein